MFDPLVATLKCISENARLTNMCLDDVTTGPALSTFMSEKRSALLGFVTPDRVK